MYLGNLFFFFGIAFVIPNRKSKKEGAAWTMDVLIYLFFVNDMKQIWPCLLCIIVSSPSPSPSPHVLLLLACCYYLVYGRHVLTVLDRGIGDHQYRNILIIGIFRDVCTIPRKYRRRRRWIVLHLKSKQTGQAHTHKYIHEYAPDFPSKGIQSHGVDRCEWNLYSQTEEEEGN